MTATTPLLGPETGPDAPRRLSPLTGERETVFFHLSRGLNALLGGRPDMTFSARCHGERLRAETLPGALLWSAAAGVIDLGCALLHGESEHCGCAWEKHRLGRS